jgi:hypothetical protein
VQELLSHVQSLERDLQHEKNEYQDQKKLVQVYREDVEKCQLELKEKSRKEVRVVIASFHLIHSQAQPAINIMSIGEVEVCIGTC